MFTRRKYALLCLVLATLENEQRQTTIKELRSVTGMEIERRAEGVALLTPDAAWTDLGLPASGTRGHATLLLAEWFGSRLRDCTETECRIHHDEVFCYVQRLAEEFQSRCARTR